MADAFGKTGRCLCGAVSYDVDGPLRDILHCHCENCRRVTGNFVASSGAATKDLIVHGEQQLKWHDLGYAKYGFCTECGSSLFWVGAEHTDRTSIQAGSLNDPSGLELVGVWFASEAQPHTAVQNIAVQNIAVQNIVERNMAVPNEIPHFDGNGGDEV